MVSGEHAVEAQYESDIGDRSRHRRLRCKTCILHYYHGRSSVLPYLSHVFFSCHCQWCACVSTISTKSLCQSVQLVNSGWNASARNESCVGWGAGVTQSAVLHANNAHAAERKKIEVERQAESHRHRQTTRTSDSTAGTASKGRHAIGASSRTRKFCKAR